MLRIKAVLFDKDGTLLDFNKTWGPAAYAVVTRLANGDARRLARLIESVGFAPGGTDLEPRSIIVSDPTPKYARVWAAILEREATPDFHEEIDRLFAEEGQRSMTLLPAVRTALEDLARRGLSLGVATNDAETNARAQLRRLGFEELLPFVAGYDSGHGPKPEPGMVLAFARHANVAPGEIAMVGDTLHDLHAARAAGAIAIAVLTGIGDDAARKSLAAEADAVIDSLRDLANAISSFERLPAS